MERRGLCCGCILGHCDLLPGTCNEVGRKIVVPVTGRSRSIAMNSSVAADAAGLAVKTQDAKPMSGPVRGNPPFRCKGRGQAHELHSPEMPEDSQFRLGRPAMATDLEARSFA